MKVFQMFIPKYNCLTQYVRVWDNGEFKNLNLLKATRNDGIIKIRTKHLKFVSALDDKRFIDRLIKIEKDSEITEFINDTLKLYKGNLSCYWYNYTLELLKQNKRITTKTRSLVINYLKSINSVCAKYYTIRNNEVLFYFDVDGPKCSFRMTVGLAIILIASKKLIPSRKEKAKTPQLKITDIVRQLNENFYFFNTMSNKTLESTLSVFYNSEILIEKHILFRNDYIKFNKLTVYGIDYYIKNNITNYIIEGYQCIFFEKIKKNKNN